MVAKLYDKFRLLVTLLIMSPFIIAAALAIAIGYPIYRVKKFLDNG